MTKQRVIDANRADTGADAPAAESALYADPFAGAGPCTLAQSVDPAFRAAVIQYCPRCGRERDQIAGAEAPDCILQGIDLDNLALDGEAGPQLLLPEALRSKRKA